MKTIASLVILAAAPALASAQATKEDVIKLAKAGISEDVILTYLKANGYDGKPSSDDLVELKTAGVSDRVLEGILSPAPARTESTVAPTYTQERTYPTGYLSVSPAVSYYSYYPSYPRYYSWGTFSRPCYTYSYYRPAYYRGSYYRSSYCGPRFSFSRHGYRSGSRVRW